MRNQIRQKVRESGHTTIDGVTYAFPSCRRGQKEDERLRDPLLERLGRSKDSDEKKVDVESSVEVVCTLVALKSCVRGRSDSSSDRRSTVYS